METLINVSLSIFFGIFLIGVPYLLHSILTLLREILYHLEHPIKEKEPEKKVPAELMEELRIGFEKMMNGLTQKRKPKVMDDLSAYELEQKHLKSRRPSI